MAIFMRPEFLLLVVLAAHQAPAMELVPVVEANPTHVADGFLDRDGDAHFSPAQAVPPASARTVAPCTVWAR